MRNLNFCTLFNSAYLTRGLEMYRSLIQHCKNAHLFVFAFDDESYNFLKKENNQSLTVISLNDFEDRELLAIKSSRTAGEYCWTCTPSTILYCIEKFNLDNCTYLDADLQFYEDPKILWNEAGENSVIITKHNYTSSYDQSVKSGIYCVQFVGIRSDINGMKVLRWWRNACIEWCYARVEDGKFGDQKYLDDWTERFIGVHVVENAGAGIAPWNCQQYNFEMINNKITGTIIETKKKFGVIFFHFHGLIYYEGGTVMLTGNIYYLSKEVIIFFYKPYVKSLQYIKSELKEKSFTGDPQGIKAALKVKPGFLLNLIIAIKSIKNKLLNILTGNFKSVHSYNHYYIIDSFTASN